jgi:hypothetical protein
MSLFYSAIFPLGVCYSALSCFVSFWVDKYCLLRLFKQKPREGDKLVRLSRRLIAFIILIHCIATSHFFYSWPWTNLCITQVSLNEEGLARASFLNADTTYIYNVCDSVSKALMPPVRIEPWFQSGEDQVKLVGFYNAMSIAIIVYILIAYFGFDAAFSIHELLFRKHRSVGDVVKDGDGNSILYQSVESGEGYVPQVHVSGVTHAVTCCCAVGTNAGNLEFQPYLLNWTASQEFTQSDFDQQTVPVLSPDQASSIYKAGNIFFDSQLSDMSIEERMKIFGRAKQYTFAAERTSPIVQRSYTVTETVMNPMMTVIQPC